MRAWKIIKWCLLGCLLLPIALILTAILIFICLWEWKYDLPLNQPMEQIVKIELLDTHESPNLHHHNEEILYTLEGSEIEIFMDKFEDLKFQKNLVHPHVWRYGLIAVRITYQDGSRDTFGLEMNTYPGDEDWGYYYFSDYDALISLFCEYVDPSQIPTEMTHESPWYYP